MKVLLVDDHEMVRLGLKSFLSMQTDIEQVLEAKNGHEGVELALKERPDVIIMDIVMPELNGIDAGAKGYILKTSSATEILQAVRKVAKGEFAIETEVSQKVESRKNHAELHDDLTARERDILALLTKGYENQRIADELFISLKTVKTHVSNILSKLEVSDRTQAVVYAFRHHLVNQEDF